MRANPAAPFNGDNARARAAGLWVAATLLDDRSAAEQCKGLGMSVTRAQAEGTGGAGGFTVPHEIETDVLSLRDSVGVFRREARNLTMASDAKTWPKRNGGLTAHFVGENQVAAEQQASWTDIGFAARKLITLTRIPSELMEDAVGLGVWFVEEIASAMAAKEDACGFNGDGGQSSGGIVGGVPQLLDGGHGAGAVVAATNHDTLAEIDAADLAELVGTLPERAVASAKWYCSASAVGRVFVRLGAATGGTVMTARGPRPMLSYAGIPIVPTSQLPSIKTSLTGQVMLLLGDLYQTAAIATRRGVEVMASEHRYLELDQVAIKGRSRFDINVHDLGNATTAGSMVGLVGA